MLVVNTAVEPTASFASIRHGIALINKWLLTPSLLVVLVSGLLAIAASDTYKNAGWAWTKALLGLVTFEGTLLTIVGNGRRAAEHAASAVAGRADAMSQVTEALRTEWGALWLMLGLGLVNIVLAVWRPRSPAARYQLTSNTHATAPFAWHSVSATRALVATTSRKMRSKVAA